MDWIGSDVGCEHPHWIGLEPWVHGLDWIGLGQQKWTHVQLWRPTSSTARVDNRGRWLVETRPLFRSSEPSPSWRSTTPLSARRSTPVGDRCRTARSGKTPDRGMLPTWHSGDATPLQCHCTAAIFDAVAALFRRESLTSRCALQ